MTTMRLLVLKRRLRFYAGTPLLSGDGQAIGTLAIADRKPRSFSEQQRDALEALGRQVMAQLELRRHLSELARTLEEHKQTEDRLRNSESFYQTLVETLPQNILPQRFRGAIHVRQSQVLSVDRQTALRHFGQDGL